MVILRRQASPQSFENSITASTTQTQGQQPLNASNNIITVVANDNDVVTLPGAGFSNITRIFNTGANTLQIFPASGDDLGNGTNISTVVGADKEIEFVSLTSTSWKILATTDVFHAEMHDEDNVNEFVINAVGEEHGYHTGSVVSGDLSSWTFDIGGGGTSFPIASIADAGGGDITVTTTGTHGLAVGDIVSQTNLADSAYVGMFKVLTVPTTTTYTVTAVFTATDTGTMDQPATLTCTPIAAGTYAIDYSLSGTTSTNNETFDFEIFNDAVEITGTKRTNKFGTGGDMRTVAGCGITIVAANAKINLALDNGDSAGNFTIEDFSVRLIKL